MLMVFLHVIAATFKWSRPTVNGNIPGARDGHSACVINGKMYIFGGYEEYVDKFSNEVHYLDFSTMTWELVKSYVSQPTLYFHLKSFLLHCYYIYVCSHCNKNNDTKICSNAYTTFSYWVLFITLYKGPFGKHYWGSGGFWGRHPYFAICWGGGAQILPILYIGVLLKQLYTCI